MHEEIELAMEEFSARLKELFAEDLLALVLYGSAVGSAYNAGVSDINVLIILEKSSAAKIFDLGETVKHLIYKHRISPFIMTHEEFTSSADVFPLEYCDILDANALIYGNKEILEITVDKKNLRSELEEKLRGAVTDIRAMLMSAEGNGKLLRKLITDWSGIGSTLFRALLRLKGISVSGKDYQTIIAEIEKEYSVSLESFLILNRLRHDKNLHIPIVLDFADKLLEPLKALVRAVDAMDGGAA